MPFNVITLCIKPVSMIRILFFTAIYILTGINNYAQTVTVSPESIADDNYDNVKVIGQCEQGFYLLQSNLSLESERDRIGFKNRKYKLSFYDFSLQQKWSKKLEKENDAFNIETVVLFNNKPCIIFSQWKRNENNITLYADVFDESGKLLLVDKKIGTLGFDKNSELSKPKVVLSQDKHSAVIFMEEERSADQVVPLLVMDTSFNIITNQRPVINYDTKNLVLTSLVLADDGQVIALGQLREKGNHTQRKQLLQYKMFVLQNGSGSFREFNVTTNNRPITDAGMSVDNLNKKVVVCGFYADNESAIGTGVLFASLKLNAEAEIELKNVPVKSDNQVRLTGERYKNSSSSPYVNPVTGSVGLDFPLFSSSGSSLYAYPIRKLILRSDGGAVIVSEAAYTSEYSYYDYFTQTFMRRVEYHYDNVVMMSINTNGTVDWSQVLRKEQESLDDGGYLSSIATLLQSGKISFIYNNDIGRNNEVVLYSVNNKGVKEEKTISRSNEHISIIPRSGKQVAENIFIAGAIHKKRLYMVKVTL